MMQGVPRFDAVSHDWAWMVQALRARAVANEAFRPLADLCAWLAASPYAAAGLSGVLSMHDAVCSRGSSCSERDGIEVRSELVPRLHQR
jgi:hypothetical protein